MRMEIGEIPRVRAVTAIPLAFLCSWEKGVGRILRRRAIYYVYEVTEV